MDVPEDEYNDYNDGLDGEQDVEDDFDCHLGRDGQCTAAGSEMCDWECPMRDSEFFAGSKAWNEKHYGGQPGPARRRK